MNHMQDYFVNLPTPEFPAIELPWGSDYLPTNIVTVEADWENNIPPVLMPGNWFIVSMWNAPIPDELEDYVVSDGDRDVGIPLPAGGVNITVGFGGMTVLPPV